MTRPVPPTLITDEPKKCIEFNEQWSEYILEALQKLNHLSGWEGSNPERYTAQQQIEILMNQLKDYCPMPNILKFTALDGQQDNGSVATFDFTDSLIAGSRQFDAHYGFGVGDVIEAVFTFNAFNSSASRNVTIRPQFAGTNFGPFTIPILNETAKIKLGVVIAVRSFMFGSTYQFRSDYNLMVLRGNQDNQRHYFTNTTANFDIQQAHSFRLFTGWAPQGGATSSLTLTEGYLKYSRVT